MSTQQTIVPQAPVPSLKKLLTATGIALFLAGAILIAIVLPAEYGIDPLGTGRALHLSDLANVTEQPQKPAAALASATNASDTAPEVTSINPVLVPSPTGDAPTVKNTLIAQRRPFQFDSREIARAQ
jgi:hypothetical protein